MSLPAIADKNVCQHSVAHFILVGKSLTAINVSKSLLSMRFLFLEGSFSKHGYHNKLII